MTPLFLLYELKVAVLIATFYIFWRLMLANETWHRLNRIVLIATAVASFVLPLCVITIHETVVIDSTSKIEGVAEGRGGQNESLLFDIPQKAETDQPHAGPPQKISPVQTTPPYDTPADSGWRMDTLLAIIYIIGVLVVLSRMVLSLWRLHRMKQQSDVHLLDCGCEVAVCEEATTPFSWWNTVFMNQTDYDKGNSALLTHELEHIRLHHSADVLLVELLTALQWFNPTMWMLRADLRTIHEYEADEQVISHGFDDIQYLHLLIRKAASRGGYSLANGIAISSTLKKRVTMIMKPKSNRWQWLRLAYLLPIVATSLYTSCEKKTEYKSQEEAAVILTEKDSTECWGIKAPVGAFYSWIVNGHLAERSIVEEDSRWNVLNTLPTESYAVFIDGREVSKADVPYIPLSNIKELKLQQGEMPRRIELFTTYVSGFSREKKQEWPEEFKNIQKHWMFVNVMDAATGRRLKGATVSIEGTDQKILTNDEGWCELKVPLGSTLKAEYQGMEPQTRRIDTYNGNTVQGCSFALYQPGKPIYHIDALSKDQEPVFPGDMEKWLAEHVQLSDSIRQNGRMERVTVWFVVNEDGSVSGARLMQGIRKELNEEAIRVVSSMPRWKPATKDGKPVKCLRLATVSF